MKTITNLFKLIFFSIVSFSCFSQSLSNISNGVSDYIDSNKVQSTSFLKKMVDIDSQTENLNGVRKVGAAFSKELQALGFQIYWECMPKERKKAGNLFAIRTGLKGQRLLLIGHLDTVFSSSKHHRFEQIKNNWAKGVGVSDMKGGDIVILQALKALQAQNLLQDTTIRIALMGDEENTGPPNPNARAELKKLAKQSDVVLDFESGPPSLGRRGISSWMLKTEGIGQHSSLIFKSQAGYGAIYEIARILNTFARKLSHTENLTINPSMMLGGSAIQFNSLKSGGTSSGKLNVIANTALAIGDLRYISVAQKMKIEKIMQDIVKAHYSHTHAKLSFVDIIPPMTPTPQNEVLLNKLQSINTLLKEPPLQVLPPKLRGAGDISYIANDVPAGLVGLGPIGKYEHSLNEKVDLDSVHIASKRAALLIYVLTHGDH